MTSLKINTDAQPSGVEIGTGPYDLKGVADVVPFVAAKLAPIPLEGQPQKQPDYPLKALGPIMGPMAASIVDNIQVSAPMAAQCVLAAASLTAQQFADVRPPHFSAKNKPCSLFLMVRAESGERKSAALNAALGPIHKWQRELARRDEVLRPAYSRSKSIHDKLVSRAESSAKTMQQAQDAIDVLGPAPMEPLSPSLIMTEPTIEGYLKSATYSHAGRAIITDEAGAFLGGHSMSAEKRQGAITMLSKAWDGADIVLSRVGRETPPVCNKRLTMCLMGQGVVINPLLSDPLANGQGFLARFLTVSAPSMAGYRSLVSAQQGPIKAIENWNNTIFSIWETRSCKMLDGTQNELDPQDLELSDAAIVAWEGFAIMVEHSMRPDGQYFDIKPFASKIAEQALRLAGVMHVLEFPASSLKITGEIMARAIELAQFYLDEHLRLVQETSVEPVLSDAQRLFEWIAENRGRHIYRADLNRNAPSKVRGAKALDMALEILIDHRFIAERDSMKIDGSERKDCYEVLA